MGDVLTFTPRLCSPEPASTEPLVGGGLRASLEEAAQIALDAADRIIAVLDRMDGDTDLEDYADDEPSLAAPEIVLPVVAAKSRPAAEILPWRGRGNVITATGVAILDMMAGGER